MLAPNGRCALTCGFDHTARLWDVASGREIQRLVGHAEAVKDAAFLCGGAQVVTSADDGTARVWDAASGAELRRLTGHVGFVFSLAVTPDERTLLTTAGGDGSTCVWALADERPPRLLRGHSRSIRMALSGDGRSVLSGGIDGVAHLADRMSGETIWRVSLHRGAVESCALSPDGRLALTGGMDRVARLWDAASGALIHELRGHTLMVQAAAFFDGGRRAITGSSDGTARVWDTASGACLLTLAGHTTQIFGVAASPDDRLIATGSVDQTTRVWDARDGRHLITLPTGASCVAFTPDGAGVITGGWSGWIGRWRLSDSALEREYAGHTQSVWGVRCYGGRLLSASADGTARLWDLATGAELRRVGGGSGMSSAELTPDGAQIVSGHADGSVRVWDADIGATIADVAGRLRRDFYDHERAQFGVAEG